VIESTWSSSTAATSTDDNTIGLCVSQSTEDYPNTKASCIAAHYDTSAWVMRHGFVSITDLDDTTTAAEM